MVVPPKVGLAATLQGPVLASAIAERYRPVRLLSSGPDGSAWLAQAAGEGTLVELRQATVAHADPARWRAIDALAGRYALLEDPCFRRLIARGAVEGTPALVFDGTSERSLAVRLALGPLSARGACETIEPITAALSEAHSVGLLHGRLVPSRVLLDDTGAPRLDFTALDVGGEASAFDAACAVQERDGDALDASSDVCALGLLLRALLGGAAPAPGARFGPLDALIVEMTQPEREARPRLDQIGRSLRAIARELRRTDATSIESHATMQAWPQVSSPPRAAESAPRVERLRPGMALGRFELLHKIGEGGMGEVYRAVDRTSGEIAALKVLHEDASEDPEKARRFRKEARILREIQSPYIAGLIELNRDAGIEFLALEFVEGQDLADRLAARGGRLPEREALQVVADVCRGLAEAHARGIVHRDIKPENVLIAAVQDAGGAPAHRVKLCDFGIARALEHRGGTLGFTIDGNILGTPAFMAPEQCSAETLSPATDVYALGVMLFQLIAGRTPFEHGDVMALLYAQAQEPPPPLASLAPEVSAATSELVARMLQKKPVDRPLDAAAVLDAIERILRGEPTAIEAHPQRPTSDPERVVRHVFEWDLRASPEALWPYVSNTDRLNRAVGLPAADFERFAETNTAKTFGSNRVAGVDLRWREHPFEWIEGRRWGVLRVFERGVMRWYTIELELLPRTGGGTRLRYTMTLEPRHMVGRVIVALEMNGRQRAALGKAFARIDAYAAASAPPAPGADPFEAPEPLAGAQRALLEQRVLELRADGVPDDVLIALADFCEHAPAQAVARLRPLAFARAHRLDEEALVEGCLRAARSGLLLLLWDVLCPLCRVPSDFAGSLQTLKDHGRCPSCNVDFPLDFAQSLELVFRVSPAIRDSDLRTYCVGGPAFAPHVVAQVRLAPGECVDLTLELGLGAYTIRSPQLPQSFAVQVAHAGRSHRQRFRFAADQPPPGPPCLLAPGALAIGLENLLDREIVARVERAALREDALTAARAACLASFRKLFPNEVLASGRLVAVGRTAFTAVHVHQQRRLLEQRGDAAAFECVLSLIARIEQLAEEEGGAVVKTASGTTLCAFGSSGSALRAALGLRTLLARAADDEKLRALDVRIAVHDGAAVAATFDGRLDYFGQTVEHTLDLAFAAPAGWVLLSPTMARDPIALAEIERAACDMEAPEGLGFCMLVRPGAGDE